MKTFLATMASLFLLPTVGLAQTQGFHVSCHINGEYVPRITVSVENLYDLPIATVRTNNTSEAVVRHAQLVCERKSNYFAAKDRALKCVGLWSDNEAADLFLQLNGDGTITAQYDGTTISGCLLN